MVTMLRRHVLVGSFALAIAGAAVLLSSSGSGIAATSAPQGPPPATQFVQGLGDRAVKVLSDPNRTHQKIRAEFAKMLQEGFDLDTIGRFVLGRYWNSAT